MKLSLFDDYRLGVWAADDSIVDATGLLPTWVAPAERMNAVIADWDALRPLLESLATGAGRPAGSVRFQAPQPRPTKIIAAPVNHVAHRQEMIEAGGFSDQPGTIEKYVGFLKAPSSLVGATGVIELPFTDRRVDHEAELGVVLARRSRHVPREEALRHVFGYLPLLDITLRGDEDRPYRKSFDTFTPIGPAIVTADEVPDPAALEVELTVNGEVRQSGSMSGLIYDVPRLIEVYSAAMTLEPGDVIATGTMDGVSAIAPDDEVRLSISGMPPLSMRVVAPRVVAGR